MPRFSVPGLRTAAIHVADGAALPIAFAAQELQRYLRTMTGATVPISPAASLRGRDALVLGQQAVPLPVSVEAGDGFVIHPEATNITLAAGSPRALLRAAYALLEQLGCRWSLDAAREQVPWLSVPAVEIDPTRHAPTFSVRGYCSDIMTWHYTQPEYLSEHLKEDRAFVDWMAKSGANTFFFIRHPFDTQLTIPELLPDFERRGIDVEYGGHVIPLLLPREVYRNHPEYFPQSPDGARTDNGNLCTSSAGALATASTNAVRYAHEHPEMRVVHIWGADLWRGGWCGCTACAAVSVQDQGLRVCNAVARALADAGVTRPVCYLAYHDTIEPEITVRPERSVTVEFAPRERCYGHALNDPDCGTNRGYASALERYVDLFDGRVRLFEYYGDAILFAGCAVPLAGVIAADVDYYKRLGVPEITMLQFGAFSRWAYPLNFVTFAAALTGEVPETAGDHYCAQFRAEAAAARTLFAELEAIIGRVVTYGDIRRPPRSATAAAGVLDRLESALPRLGDVIRKCEAFDDPALAALVPLVRYTQLVFEGVRQELRQVLAGRPPHAELQYAEALQVVEGVDPRWKGVWGSVDLPIINSFYNVAAVTT
ncbi:MAG: DUF4838 domain-containing protein [Candidatus Binatia bacterium]